MGRRQLTSSVLTPHTVIGSTVVNRDIIIVTDMIEVKSVSENELNVIRKHEKMIKQQQLEMTQNTYQTTLTERDQTDMMMKKQLLLLQLEMIENELKQAELIERLKTTQGTIEQLQNNQPNQEPNTRHNVPPKCQHQATDREDVTNSTEPYFSYFSCCYHGPISWQESVDLLKHCSEGTFLVRDSQNPRFMYSLSFQRGEREGGPTSIRICLERGRWSLDCEVFLGGLMPSFVSIDELLQYYVNLGMAGSFPVKLSKPLPCREHT